MIISLAVPQEEEWRLYSSSPEEPTVTPELETEFSSVWAEGNTPGLAKNHAPVLIDLKPVAQPVKIWQYMVPPRSSLGNTVGP